MKKSRLSLLLIPFILSSCSKAPTLEHGKFFACNALFDITSYNDTNENITKLEDEIIKYSDLFDAFESHGDLKNIYTINQTNEEVVVSEELFNALEKAVYYYEESEGYFNPFLGEITLAYKESYQENKLPSKEAIQVGLNNLKTFKFLLNKDKKSVKRQGNSKIDLGAFAKGYALEKAKELAKELDIDYYFISGGGSSNYFTTKPEDVSYKAGFRDIKNKYMEVKNTSLGVSSIFEQFVTINNKKYSHIINPFTGEPSMIYDLSIVKHDSCILTDVFSTVLMIAPTEEKIKEFATKFNFEYIIYKDNKCLYKSNDIELVNK